MLVAGKLWRMHRVHRVGRRPTVSVAGNPLRMGMAGARRWKRSDVPTGASGQSGGASTAVGSNGQIVAGAPGKRLIWADESLDEEDNQRER